MSTSAPVHAEDYAVAGQNTDKYSYAWGEKRFATRIGIGVALDGGVGGFVDSRFSDTLFERGQGVWGLRVTLGSHTPLGIDVGYVGTISTAESIATDNDAHLIGTNLETALRWNILPHFAWCPFIFAGAGWQHYNVTNTRFSLADQGIADNDDLAVFPMGAGLSYRDRSGLTVDLRGTYRIAQNADLIVDPRGRDVSLDTWSANAAIGYEF